MQKRLLILALLAASSAQAGVFRCEKDGKASYQDSPCDASSTSSSVVVEDAASRSKLPWEGLRHGMSMEDVQRNMRGTTKVSGSHLADGALERLRKEDIRLAGFTFEASYFFHDDAFTQVNVNDNEVMDNEAIRSKFDKVSAALSAKYGQATNQDVRSETWGLSGKANWFVGGDELWLTIVPVTADTSMLTFGYRPAG